MRFPISVIVIVLCKVLVGEKWYESIVDDISFSNSVKLRENVTNSNARFAIDLASNIDNGTNDREKYQSWQ